MSLIIGVDEAGRGPVIGPMIVVGVMFREESVGEVVSLGVRDSKTLDRRFRETLYQRILEIAEKHSYVKIEAREIDRENLNALFYQSVVRIVEDLIREAPLSVKRITVDLTGHPRTLEVEIRKLGFPGELILEYKADRKYPEVSAASIVAKVVRDREIEVLKKLYGDFGSGYPSDPKTRRWVREYYVENNTLPAIVRRSWKTIKKLAPRMYVEKRIGRML